MKFVCPHDHIFISDRQHVHEKRVWIVILITVITMILEIAAGLVFGSMSLLADGWHMASHVSAMGITAFAYYFSRKHLNNSRFTFGTGKIGDLAGYSSALLLAFIAIYMAYESVKRMLAPIEIAFNEAIAVACVGLMVNLISAWALKEHSHVHDDGPDHHDNQSHDQGHDHNLRAAYIHVLADALTSILAILALVLGRYADLVFLDPLMGIVGAGVISCWAYGLMRETASVLLDVNHNTKLNDRIRNAVEEKNTKITDLHVWRVGSGHYSAIISLNSLSEWNSDFYKTRLCTIKELSHVTVEINKSDYFRPE